jgi:WD40 repeat protein
VINSLLVSPDGKYLFVGAKYLRMYSVESGKLIGVLGERQTTSGVKSMKIDYQGENLISVHYDGSVICHQISGKQIFERYAPKEDTAVHWVEFIQDYKDFGYLLIDDGVRLKKLSIPGLEESSFGRSERFRVETKKA